MDTSITRMEHEEFRRHMEAENERLESRDGEMWRKVSGYIITAVIGIVIGFIFTQLGM